MQDTIKLGGGETGEQAILMPEGDQQVPHECTRPENCGGCGGGCTSAAKHHPKTDAHPPSSKQGRSSRVIWGKPGSISRTPTRPPQWAAPLCTYPAPPSPLAPPCTGSPLRGQREQETIRDPSLRISFSDSLARMSALTVGQNANGNTPLGTSDLSSSRLVVGFAQSLPPSG